MRTLVLTLEYPSRASYYADWCEAFARSKQLKTTIRNVLQRSARRGIMREIGDYELIVVLHSCTADTLDYVTDLASALQSRRGRLVSFVGNEVNLPWVRLHDKIAWLRSVAPDLIVTQLLAEAGQWLYAETGAEIISLPHALNPSAFRPTTPQRQRSIDIGARSWRYLAYLGDNDRNRIYDYFLEHRFEPPLALDFSTEHRFDRAGWASFLDRCKATIATEAGSWYLERDDATVLAIRDAVARSDRGLMIRADSPLTRIARRLPYRVKVVLRALLRQGPLVLEASAAERLDFADIHRRFFAGRSKAPVYGKCISSRHFDAIGCKTLQIMFPGRYNDILQAGEHYVALAEDFSNVESVIDTLRSPESRSAIVERAWQHVMAAHTYEHRLDALLAKLDAPVSVMCSGRHASVGSAA